MAASRVRVVVEYRNGDNNFLAQYSGEFVKCKGERDRAAVDAAYLTLCEKEDERLHMIKEALQRLEKVKAGHD